MYLISNLNQHLPVTLYTLLKRVIIVKFKQNLIKPYLNSHINIYWKNKKAFKEKAREQRKITVITVLLYYIIHC